MGTVEEVRIAKRTGFCYGVREAIDKAKEASAAGKATHTLGQVVHNEGVVRDLQDLASRPSRRSTTSTTAQPSSSAPTACRPDVMARAEARGLEVIDGTCTWVIQEQKELTRLVEEGYTIVILGTPKHPEVVGLLGLRARRHRGRRGRGVGRGDPAQEADGPAVRSRPSRPGSSRSWRPSWSRGPTS